MLVGVYFFGGVGPVLWVMCSCSNGWWPNGGPISGFRIYGMFHKSVICFVDSVKGLLVDGDDGGFSIDVARFMESDLERLLLKDVVL